MSSSTTTDWNITTDIYGIVDSLKSLQQDLIEDEDETTLALGIYGYITDTEAKKIQSSVVMTGQLGNEMFPLRAKLTKNVLAHAVYNNITDVNAVPAHMTINIGIKVDDLDNYMEDGKFVFDAMCPLFVGDYEFHFDYDIILTRSKNGSGDDYVYSAHYDMSETNNLSNITEPYLKQPFKIKLGNYDYVVLNALVRQCSIEETTDKMISDSVIENKTYTFEFANQLADFQVYVTDNNVTTRLTPILYGSSPSEDVTDYCWYLFISDNTVRITFDSKSYTPGLNSDIYIKAYTTLGDNGEFSYKKIDDSYMGLYTSISSDTYNYSNITCYMIALTDSTDGSDKKTKSQLQKLIPKAALSRGSYTTETDVTNYFNLIDSEENRLVVQRKVDNNISRVWYGYFLLKDELSNIVPTNTITLKLNINDGSMYKGDDGRYVLPAGTIIFYNATNGFGEIMDEVDVPELYSDDYFDNGYYYYMTVYNLILDLDPLYAAFYLTISNKDSFFIFNWVNEESVMQFVANRCHFERNLLTDQSQYKFTFSIAQSISSNDYELYKEESVIETTEDGKQVTNTIVTNKMKTILVLYQDDVPYRWVEGTLTSFDSSKYISSWEIDLETDNEMDTNNLIKILDLHVAGKATDMNYGYFSPNIKAVLYTLAKFDDGEYGRYDLDTIAPGLDGYTVTNIYEVDSGLDFYENFTNVLDTKVSAINKTNFSITGVPCVGFHYMTDEDHATYLVDAIAERKAYIEYCLELLENNMDIDFKFFNTYGPSSTYTIGDEEETLIGHVDMSMKFRVSLKNTSDQYTKGELITRIKEYMEDLYETDDWHAPNMITDITNEFSSRINFLEFMNYNNLRLGLQHIEKLDIDDPHVVPEFLNIRNRYDTEGNLEPCIDIEVVS